MWNSQKIATRLAGSGDRTRDPWMRVLGVITGSGRMSTLSTYLRHHYTVCSMQKFRPHEPRLKTTKEYYWLYCIWLWYLVSHLKGGAGDKGVLNKVLRKIFWAKREITGKWRKLHNVELYALYSSSNISLLYSSPNEGHIVPENSISFVSSLYILAMLVCWPR